MVSEHVPIPCFGRKCLKNTGYWISLNDWWPRMFS